MKFSKDEVNRHIRINSVNTYSMAVELAAIFFKLYGELPQIGLSNTQAEMAKSFAEELPDKI